MGKSFQELEDLKTKYTSLSQQSTYDNELRIQEKARLKSIEEEKSLLETRLHKTESELTSCEIAKENLKRDKVVVSTRRFQKRIFIINFKPLLRVSSRAKCNVRIFTSVDPSLLIFRSSSHFWIVYHES